MTTQLNSSLLYFPLNAISPYTKLIVPFPSKEKKKIVKSITLPFAVNA